LDVEKFAENISKRELSACPLWITDTWLVNEIRKTATLYYPAELSVIPFNLHPSPLWTH